MVRWWFRLWTGDDSYVLIWLLVFLMISIKLMGESSRAMEILIKRCNKRAASLFGFLETSRSAKLHGFRAFHTISESCFVPTYLTAFALTPFFTETCHVLRVKLKYWNFKLKLEFDRFVTRREREKFHNWILKISPKRKFFFILFSLSFSVLRAFISTQSFVVSHCLQFWIIHFEAFSHSVSKSWTAEIEGERRKWEK